MKEITLRNLIFQLDGIFMIPREYLDSPAVHRFNLEINAERWQNYELTWVAQADFERKILAFLRKSVAQAQWIPEGSMKSSGSGMWFQHLTDMLDWMKHAERGFAYMRLMSYELPD